MEEGEPGERGIACEVDQFDARVTVYGDRIEAACAKFVNRTAGSIGTILESVWARLAELSPGAAAKTHSVLFEADTRIRGASYQELLNRLARPPESLPAGTETAIVYYLPAEPGRGFVESSLGLERFASRGSLVYIPALNPPRRKGPISEHAASRPAGPATPGNGSKPGSDPFCLLEREWLRRHESEYAGAWVALEGSRLVAQGSSALEVLGAAKAEGCEQPLVVHIPSEPELPFGGW